MGTLIQSDFRPPKWLSNPHLQTLWPTLTRRIDPPPRTCEVVTTPDGDFLELDWCGHQGPLVLILHGLAGSSRSHYVLGLQWALLRQGWRSVAMNFRGCGRQLNRTAKCYHSGETGDLDFIYHHIRRRSPRTPLAAVGYSLGGNVLLKWLGERGNNTDLFAACAVSVPFVLSRCADAMERGFAKVYRHRLLSELKEYLKAKIRHLERLGQAAEAEKLRALGDLRKVRSFWEYDDRVIARLYPFRDVHDYYRRCSSRRFLAHIRIPTLVIQSRDDPFMYPDVIPPPEETAPEVQMEITSRGGHVGFIAATSEGGIDYWLEHRIPLFLRQQLSQSGHLDLNLPWPGALPFGNV